MNGSFHVESEGTKPASQVQTVEDGATSAVAHYVAGVLDRDAMAHILEDLCECAAFQTGDRVKTLRGSTGGVILRLLVDGRGGLANGVRTMDKTARPLGSSIPADNRPVLSDASCSPIMIWG